MRRLLRWAANGATAVSLLLAAAALAAWPASHWAGGCVVAQWDRSPAYGGPPYAWRWADLVVGRGGLGLRLGDVPASADPPAETGDVLAWRPHPAGPTYPDLSAPGRPQVDWRGLQAGWDGDKGPVYPDRSVWLVAPCWAWVLAFGLLPGWRAYRWLGRRREAHGGPAFEVVRRATSG